MEFLSNFQSTAYAGLFVAFLCLLVTWLLKGLSGKGGPSGRKYPPMIRSVPIMGSLPFMPDYSHFHTFFAEKSQTMGGIIGCYMGSK